MAGKNCRSNSFRRSTVQDRTENLVGAGWNERRTDSSDSSLCGRFARGNFAVSTNCRAADIDWGRALSRRLQPTGNNVLLDQWRIIGGGGAPRGTTNGDGVLGVGCGASGATESTRRALVSGLRSQNASCRMCRVLCTADRPTRDLFWTLRRKSCRVVSECF